jgi:thioredoxin-related protein
MSVMLRAALLALAFCAAAPALANGGRLELLFVDRSGCPWCARFEREVLPGYGLSDLGREAPLKRVSLDAGQPKEAALDEPVRFTPTFVLLRDSREIGRVVGYMDNATFYGLVEKLLADKRARTEVRP